MNYQTIISLVVALVVLFVFLWMLIPTGKTVRSGAEGDELLDPSDSRQLGTLFGMYGLDTFDAAVARFAIERFTKEHGRRPTTRDVGIIVGLMQNPD